MLGLSCCSLLPQQRLRFSPRRDIALRWLECDKVLIKIVINASNLRTRPTVTMQPGVLWEEKHFLNVGWC